MSSGINKVILIGNVGSDPETRYTPNETAVVRFSIATSETWKNPKEGTSSERTEWHRLVFFGRLAEIAGQYVRKGSKVYVEGSLRTNEWTDSQNIKRYTTEVIVNQMQLLDKKNASSGAGQEHARSAESAPEMSFDDTEDDIPF